MAKLRVAPGSYERSRGVYDLVVSAGKDAYRQKTRTFRGTLAGAKKARAWLLAQAEAPGHDASVMTFSELLNRYIERVGTSGGSPHRVADYRGMARNHLEPVLGHVRATACARSPSTRHTTT